MESHNGCEEMLEYFDSAVTADCEPALVLMGVKLMKVPEAPYIRMAGVASDRERLIAYEAAEVTLAPDPDDILASRYLKASLLGRLSWQPPETRRLSSIAAARMRGCATRPEKNSLSRSSS